MTFASIIDTLSVPTLLLDEQKCRRNIRKMCTTAQKAGVAFRPHFKTHQSQEIGQWYKEEGVDKITVSSLQMAEYFAADGWQDITVAFPVNVREIDLINRLASEIQLNLLIENTESVKYLAARLSHPVNIFIKIDIGYHRTGLDPKDLAQIDTVLSAVEEGEQLNFLGFLGHAGHSYKVRGKAAIHRVHEESLATIAALRIQYQDRFPALLLSVGDTPTCSWEDQFEGVDEIRPGNFVFYDLAQWRIGSCQLDEIAVALACPVVAKHPDRQQLIVYGGGVHFAKDQSILLDGETTYYGHLVEAGSSGWQLPNGQNYVSALSQEHGTLTVQPEIFEQYEIGDMLLVLPIHSCMTANAMKEFLTLSGNRISRL